MAVCAAASFGLYPSAAKLAYADGANQSFLIITTTFARAGALLLAALLEKRTLLEIYKKSGEAIWSGFLQAVSIFGIIASLLYIPGPVMITIIFTHTIMLLFLMAYKGEIRLTWLALGSTLAALVGIGLVVKVHSHFAGVHKGGLLLAFIGAIATTSRFYSFGNQVKETAPSVVGARSFAYAALFTLLLAFIQTPAAPQSPTGLYWVGACCLSLSLGSVVTFYAMSLIGSFRLSLTMKLEPIFTSMYAILLMHEILDPLQYFGIGLVVSSLLVFQYFDSRSKRAAR